MKNKKGFTLLEVIIAVAIFAIISLISFRSLKAIQDNNQLSEKRLAELKQWQQFYMWLEMDLLHTINRPILTQYNDQEAAFLGSSDRQILLSFTRSGRHNPGQLKRSNLQRISYLLIDKQIIRRSWQVLDRSPDSQFDSVVLLKSVENVTLQFMNELDIWQNHWSSKDEKEPIPKAVTITIDGPSLGEISRIYRL